MIYFHRDDWFLIAISLWVSGFNISLGYCRVVPQYTFKSNKWHNGMSWDLRIWRIALIYREYVPRSYKYRPIYQR